MTWVVLDEFRKTYPAFQLEDEPILQAGRDIIYGKAYQRRHKQQVAGDDVHARCKRLGSN
jgi:hypothetical protein